MPRKLDASRVHVGSKVITTQLAAVGQWSPSDDFLTQNELRSMLGRAYDSGRDSVTVWNADWAAAAVLVLPFARTIAAGANVGVYLMAPPNSSSAGQRKSVRVGYMVVEGY